MLPYHCNATLSLQCYPIIALLPYHCNATLSLQCYPVIAMLPYHRIATPGAAPRASLNAAHDTNVDPDTK